MSTTEHVVYIDFDENPELYIEELQQRIEQLEHAIEELHDDQHTGPRTGCHQPICRTLAN
ncbi:hypothetical protein [Timonella senegalensis]|uniref:hypothetical protein n=1 Tax=Timonella senegalensis TaxID=1465825 RepID=UPI002FDE0C23